MRHQLLKLPPPFLREVGVLLVGRVVQLLELLLQLGDFGLAFDLGHWLHSRRPALVRPSLSRPSTAGNQNLVLTHLREPHNVAVVDCAAEVDSLRTGELLAVRVLERLHEQFRELVPDVILVVCERHHEIGGPAPSSGGVFQVIFSTKPSTAT